MTNEEITNGIGALVTKYAENEKRLTLLKTRIRDFAGKLTDLGQALREPERIKTLDRPALKTYTSHVDGVAVDGEEIWDSVRQYQEALDEKTELESSLEQAGLGILRRR